MTLAEPFVIRTARLTDLAAVVAIENACFPKAEAADRAALERRLRCYPSHFWLLERDGKPVAFVNGLATDERELRDEMYANAALHDEHGAWQMLFGVATLPEYRGQGCASRLLRYVAEQAKAQRRLGLALTCKQALVPFYASFGFCDEGISDSTHGGVVWHAMRLTFRED